MNNAGGAGTKLGGGTDVMGTAYGENKLKVAE
jgi:hypothetical protein